MRLDETRVITLLNNKGGIGKTSSCTALATLLGIMGYKCLVIDNDFQSNATATMILDEPINKTIVDFFKMNPDDHDNIKNCVIATRYKNVDIIPSQPEHEKTNELLYQVPEPDRYHFLGQVLESIKGNYDYILIDTHPDLYPATKNALCCSDYVITPAGADGYAYTGITLLVNSVYEISSNEELNPDLEFLGAFIAKSKPRTNNFQDYQDFYGNELGDAYIPVSVREDASVSAVLDWRMPLPYLLLSHDYRSSAKRWKAVYDYIELCREVGMIEDEDYLLARSIFEVVEGNLTLSLKKENGEVKIESLYLSKGVRDDFQSTYVEENSFAYKDLIREMNQREDLRRLLKDIIVEISDPDRILKYLPYDKKKKPYIKVKNLE